MSPVGVAFYTTLFVFGKTLSRSSTPSQKGTADCDNLKSRSLVGKSSALTGSAVQVIY